MEKAGCVCHVSDMLRTRSVKAKRVTFRLCWIGIPRRDSEGGYILLFRFVARTKF